jgi:integrase
VPDDVVEKTLPFLPPMVADMVLLQRELGCRPSEVCNIRWCDIDQSDDIWIYEPFENKMEHKKKRRLIAFRKTSQKILEKYRYRPENEFIFSPKEIMRKKYESKMSEKKLEKMLLKHKDKYSTHAYDHVIEFAAKKANVPHWFPNQLRHRFATATDRNVNREAAMIALGHSRKSTTEIYIDETAEQVKIVARMLDQKEK